MSFFEIILAGLIGVWALIALASAILTLIERRQKSKDGTTVWIDGENLYIGQKPPDTATEIKPGDHYDTPDGVRITNYGRS